MTNLGPLTTTFTPRPSCTSYDGFTRFQYQSDGFYLAQGPWMEDCFPNSFKPFRQYYYSPGICPSGYTAACSSLNSVGTSTETVRTCCPIAHSVTYVCVGDERDRFPWKSSLGCYKQITDTTTFQPFTVVSDGKTTPLASQQFTDGGLGAYAVVVRTQVADDSKTTNTAGTTAGTGMSLPPTSGGGGGNEAHGLSSGAVAGIGVGCGLAAVLIGIGAFLLWTRRRAQTRRNENTTRSRVNAGEQEHNAFEPQSSSYLVDGHQMHTSMHYPELSSEQPVHELEHK
ncbi:hypothetical protein QQS21_001437 [Conoideocrella luteorostrata]|uniref:Uncharacterized protein n=1 Tax=Conoideocrella luteorostrata TaxID=1105319 RepID=A0AAJ0CZK1_9HYPO|nr:hypothetical protein QQS21_001437 [Conoideocrella luteorostrata]